MNMVLKFTGIITPVLTPFNDDGSIAQDLYFDHCRRVLAQGSDYISPFGTSGEALSVSGDERRTMVAKLIAEGVARPDQMMPGTGLCNLAETLDLTEHAVEAGCAAVMTLPPFFFPDPGDDGLYRYFAELIERIGPERFRMCLYHIPQNTGVGISPALARKLNERFPDTVVAYKDSSGNWDNTRAVIEAAPGVSVFPASEAVLPQALAIGAGGCISATCNVNVAQIKRVHDLSRAHDQKGLDAEMPRLIRIREAVQKGGLIPTLKSILARQSGDARWLNTRSPLLNAPADLAERVGDLA